MWNVQILGFAHRGSHVAYIRGKSMLAHSERGDIY